VSSQILANLEGIWTYRLKGEGMTEITEEQAAMWKQQVAECRKKLFNGKKKKKLSAEWPDWLKLEKSN